MHWSKIDNINNTFWSDVPHELLVNKLQEQGVLEKLEKAFVAKTPTVRARAKPALPLLAKPAKVSLLPRDLAQQFGINLHMFGSLSVGDLTDKILACDHDIVGNVSVLEFFNSDALNEVPASLVRAFAPYTVDYSQPGSAPQKAPDALERADQILLLTVNMRHYWKLRSRALLLVHSYRRDFQDLEQKLDLVDEAVASIRRSDSLRHVLAIIRSVGNFMNDDSKRALGFKLDVLQRLKFMKDDSNTLTFLHYVEKIVRSNFPEHGSFVDELSVLNRMHNIVIEQLEAECHEYCRNVQNVATSAEKGNLSDTHRFHPRDQILRVLEGALESAKQKSAVLQRRLESTLEDYRLLMEYFGESPLDPASRNSFFGKFAGFVLEFKRVHIENVQKDEDERAYEEKKQSIARRQNVRGKTKTVPRADVGDASVPRPTPPEVSDIRSRDDADDDDDKEDDDKDLARAAHEDVIDKLLRELKHLGSDRQKRTRSMYIKRQSLALSTVPVKVCDDSALPYETRYEHVDSLRRRMTTRKLRTGEEVNGTEELDMVMLRAQVMLSQLRSRSSGEALSLCTRDTGDTPTDAADGGAETACDAAYSVRAGKMGLETARNDPEPH